MMDKFIMSAAALVLLNGCSMLSPQTRSSVAPDSVDLSGYFEQRLNDGRQHLSANQPTRAIEAFRQASYDARYSADAFNGMAVAYTMLGRDDVAEQLFERAIEADPSDPRFSRNLAHLKAQLDQREGSPVELAAISTETEQFIAQGEEAPVQTAIAGSVVSSQATLKPFHGEYLVTSGTKVPERLIQTRSASDVTNQAVPLLFGAAGPEGLEGGKSPPTVVRREIKLSIIRTGVEASGRALKSLSGVSEKPAVVRVKLNPGNAEAVKLKAYPIRVSLDRKGDPDPRLVGNSNVPAQGLSGMLNSKKLAASAPSRSDQAAYPIRVSLSRPK